MKRPDSTVDGAAQADSAHEAGSALVEFLSLGILLLIPLVYLILTLTELHAGKFAAASAARSAARAFVQAADPLIAHEQAATVTQIALNDQGFTDLTVPEVLHIACDPNCTAAGAEILVTVTVPVTIPGIPFVESGPAVMTATQSHIAGLESFR